MSIKYQCSKCLRVIAREDRRRTRQGFLQAVAPATLKLGHRTAPAVRCACGHRTVLVKGRQ